MKLAAFALLKVCFRFSSAVLFSLTGGFSLFEVLGVWPSLALAATAAIPTDLLASRLLFLATFGSATTTSFPLAA